MSFCIFNQHWHRADGTQNTATSPMLQRCAQLLSNMFKLLASTLLIFLTFFCNAQGSWNIGYIQIDSISKEHIGQVVRIDFKNSNPWTNSEGQRGIRAYVGMKDTGKVTIDTTLFILAERRKIYVDHGSYSDQYLECINCNQELVLMYDARIVDVNQKSIQFDRHTKKKG